MFWWQTSTDSKYQQQKYWKLNIGRLWIDYDINTAQFKNRNSSETDEHIKHIKLDALWENNNSEPTSNHKTCPLKIHLAKDLLPALPYLVQPALSQNIHN